jgi:hypothetical protein
MPEILWISIHLIPEMRGLTAMQANARTNLQMEPPAAGTFVGFGSLLAGFTYPIDFICD